MPHVRPSGRQARRQGLSQVVVQGLKSIRDRMELEIRPLTVLAGANSSGKSSAMQGLLLLKQTVEADHDSGGLKLDGPNVEFANTGEVLSARSRWKASGLTLGFSGGVRGGAHIDYEVHSHALTPVAVVTDALGEPRRRFAVGMDADALKSAVGDALPSDGTLAIVSSSGALAVEDRLPRLQLTRRRIPLVRTEQLRGLIHVRALRGSPARVYPYVATGVSFRRQFEPYCAGLVTQWQEAQDARLVETADWLARMGLTWKLAAKRVSDTGVELRVGRTLRASQGGAHDLVNIADVGFGVSQVLPVVLACTVATPRNAVYIEQPEIHLHPRALAGLADMLVATAKRGVRLVVETHSSLLLLAIQTAIARGDLPCEDVALHWFQRDADGWTTSTPAELDAAGTFGDWPVDFGDVELTAQHAYLDAHDAVRFGTKSR